MKSILSKTIKILFFFVISLFLTLFFTKYVATAESSNATTHFTPILSVWRDQNSLLVLGTVYGNFYYIYNEQVKSIDGQTVYKQQDKENALLKAIFFHSNGTSIHLHISTIAKDILVGIDQVDAPLQQIPLTRPVEPNQ